MERRKPGPKPKGLAQITLRVPADHRPCYEAAARDAGLPLSDYIALVLAQAHELPEPAYLRRNRDQGELPLTKAS